MKITSSVELDAFVEELYAKVILFIHRKDMHLHFFLLAIGQLYLEEEREWVGDKAVLMQAFRDLKDIIADRKEIRLQCLPEMILLAKVYGDIDDPVLWNALKQLSWTHLVALARKVRSPRIILFYLEYTCKAGWSIKEMKRQIAAGLHVLLASNCCDDPVAGKKSRKADQWRCLCRQLSQMPQSRASLSPK